jgi:hypothetical protein
MLEYAAIIKSKETETTVVFGSVWSDAAGQQATKFVAEANPTSEVRCRRIKDGETAFVNPDGSISAIGQPF